VGTMARPGSAPTHTAVHPHGRGDNLIRDLPQRPEAGSPPRAWGQCPAIEPSARFAAVHPHGRGDNSRTARCALASAGSPPRAWGQFTALMRLVAVARFTPTGVGTMALTGSLVITQAVHPHGRGDNSATSWSSTAHSGSPPRAWGQSAGRALRTLLHRFTPTGVGTMTYRMRRAAIRSVHPHGRGDNRYRAGRGESRAGSPPRAWGQSRLMMFYVWRLRFTPTGVGTMYGSLRMSSP